MESHEYEESYIDEYSMDMENRIKNLLWTVSGDYSLKIKPDISLFKRSKAIALYDGIKQGAFSKYFDRDFYGMYLVKKIFLGASENELTMIAQLCIEAAIGEKICQERPGVKEMRRQAYTDILDQEFEKLPSFNDWIGRLKIAVFRDYLSDGNHKIEKTLNQYREKLYELENVQDTLSIIRVTDYLYNHMIDPDFEKNRGSLETVLSVTIEDLTEFDWEDFLTEEMYEEALESYIEQLSNKMTDIEDTSVTKKMEEKRQVKHKVTVLPPEVLEKAHTYVELNYGKTYLSEAEEKRLNYIMCKGIHADCSLYFTEGILKNPVARNYQLEYAKRLKNKNIFHFHDKHRVIKRNIAVLTDLLKKAIVMRNDVTEIISDRGLIVPSRVWRIGRTNTPNIFKKEIKGENSELVVDILIDASGSQMKRQSDVAIQAYIISRALSNTGIAHRVMSYCTFWDYTILHRFREYDEPANADEDIFNYVTSSNNRDGLAFKAAAYSLSQREEEKKIMIVLSDGRPYDVIVNRPNAKNPSPYMGDYAIADTASEVRKMRNQGISVLGVFAGEEKDLSTEKKIFGKDFAYIKDISNFSKIVGRYLLKQLEQDL